LKNRTKLLLTTILALFLLAPLMVQVDALQMGPGNPQGPPTDPGKIPDHEIGPNGTVWIKTDIITIMANGEFPSFHFWYTADDNGANAKFMLSYNAIVEFEDANGDLAFQSNETLNFAPLAAYEWILQTGEITDGEITTEVWLKYTKSGTRADGPLAGVEPAMDGPGSVHEYEDVSIQIWAHIYLEDYYGAVTDSNGVKANYTIAGGSELKMDIMIGNFPFSTETSSVALQTLLKENGAAGDMNQNQHRYMTRERTRNMTGDSSNVSPNMTQSESMFMNRVENHTQKVDFTNTETGTVEGFFSWVDKAIITLPGEESEVVDVTVSYVPTMNGLALYLAYPNFDNGTLLHDPSIGLIEDSAPLTTTDFLPSLYLIAGIGAVAIAIVGIAFIRRK